MGFPIISREQLADQIINTEKMGTISAAKIAYGTIGAVKISGERITYGTIGSVKISAERLTYGSLDNLRLKTIVQDGTCTLTFASAWVSFPVAFAAAPRAVLLTPMAEAGEVHFRVTRINPGSFAAIGTPGGKNYYYLAKGSRA